MSSPYYTLSLAPIWQASPQYQALLAALPCQALRRAVRRRRDRPRGAGSALPRDGAASPDSAAIRRAARRAGGPRYPPARCCAFRRPGAAIADRGRSGGCRRGDLMRPEALDERLRLVEQRAEALGAAGADDVVGVLPGGQGREGEAEAGAQQRQRAHRGAHRGFLSGRVAVEAENGDGDHPPDQPELRLGQRGAERRDGVADPRLGEREDVHIAFDDDDPVRLPRGGGRLVEIVERAALVEQRRVGRIEIFGLAIAQYAAAERDHPPARVADRDHQAPAEPIVGVLVVDRNQHARFDEHRGREFLERFFQRAAAVGGEAETEGLARCVRNATLLEIFARRGAVAAAELLDEPVGGALHDVAQARRLLGLFRGARVGGGDLHAGLAGEVLDRVHERQPALVGHPADSIAVGRATEAVVEALFVVDREAGRLFVMERTARLILAAGACDLHRAADEGRQGDARAELAEPLRGERVLTPPPLSPDTPSPFVSSEVETRLRPAWRPSPSLRAGGG